MMKNFGDRLLMYRDRISHQACKTVLFMGGSQIHCWRGKFIVETNVGTFGSIFAQIANYPWLEANLTNMSLAEILTVNSDTIFVQTYAQSKMPLSLQLTNNRIWRQLTIVHNHQVYEVEQLWHYGNGTRMIRLTLDKLILIIIGKFINEF